LQVAANTYRLQLSARTAGVDNDSNIAASEFGATLGGFVSLTAASDAHLTVGSGDGAYTITSETNTISGLLPGVTVTLKKETDDPVTITAARDTEAIADSVQSLIDAANAVKQAVDASTKFDPETRKASPLTGDSTIRRLMSSISRAITDAVPTSPLGSPGLAGVSVDKTGAFTFDRAEFIEKFNEDPTGMEELFVQGGTATDTQVSFVSSGDRTRVGTYDVVITQAATQANDVGLEGSWPMGSPPTVRVRVGSNIAEYTVGVTDTQQDVVDGLNSAFAAEGLSLEATISGTGVKVSTTAYGTSAKFDVAWDGATYESIQGVDVAGTIDGVTATGSGQNLAIPFDNTHLGGLTLKITATAPGALGSFTYEPGLAQRLSTAILDATDIASGYVTSTEKTLKSRIEFVNRQVDSMESRLVQYEARLKRQYASLEATLGILQQQSQWLAGQIAGLQ
jgi:flagellar hook-associated protein 2